MSYFMGNKFPKEVPISRWPDNFSKNIHRTLTKSPITIILKKIPNVSKG